MKIAKIDIQTFRGIPGRCSLDFRDKSGHACSAIIYGGNGSGKSSIVDALEFNLQGRIERNDPFKNAMRPSALSVFYKDFKQAHTSVEFVDGSVFKRDIFVLYDQLSDNFDFSIEPSEHHELFRYTPIVLRRNDIISFNRCSVSQKQVLLSEFFYDFTLKAKTPENPDVMHIQNEILQIKNGKRDPLIEKLSTLLHINQIELQNAIYSGMEAFIKARFTIRGRMEFTKSKKNKRVLGS